MAASALPPSSGVAVFAAALSCCEDGVRGVGLSAGFLACALLGAGDPGAGVAGDGDGEPGAGVEGDADAGDPCAGVDGDAGAGDGF